VNSIFIKTQVLKLLLTTLLFFWLLPLSSVAQSVDPIVSISERMYIPHEKKINFTIGNTIVPVSVLQFGDSSDIVYINLHANETTSYTAARSVLPFTGGTIIKIDNSQQRIIRFMLKGVVYRFDPNRIYSAAGIEATLRENSRYSLQAAQAIEQFATALLALIPDSTRCIVALHNNTEEMYSIKSYLPGGSHQKDAKAVYQNIEKDVDDIALTTDSLLYNQMATAGYNSIWQDNEQAKKDGSLSIYFGERNKRYINIETQHGHLDQYKEMLTKLISFLNPQNQIDLAVF